jgi:AbiV family abortive infection protein
MAEKVTPEYLLKGAVYSLEQCGLLLRDADLLYRSGAYPSAVVLAAFAWEALGQWKILLNLRQKVINGKPVTIADIKTRCRDHEEKQRAGMSSITMQADQGSGLGQLLMTRMTAQSASAEWKKADDTLTGIHRQIKRQVPSRRHEQRELALYVNPIEPVSADRWTRPTFEISKTTAQRLVTEARNDYAGQLENRYSNLEFVKYLDAELCAALEKWADRPTLQSPGEPLPL